MKHIQKNKQTKIKNIHFKDICKSITSKIKKLGNVNVITILIIVLIIILFWVNTYVTITQNSDYQKKVQSGNDRWEQVEQIYLDTKNEVDILNNKINELEQKIDELHN